MKKLLIALAFACNTAYAVTFDNATQWYVRQDFEQAYAAFDELAKIGNEKALFNIAVMHLRGEFVAKDHPRALAWARLAEEHGSDSAKTTVPLIVKNLDPKQLAKADAAYLELATIYGRAAVQDNYLSTHVGTGRGAAIQPALPSFFKAAEYPKGLARAGIGGTADVQFVIDKDGTVRFAEVMMATDPRFGDAAVEAILGSRFEPAQLAGSAVREFGGKYRYSFQIAGTELEIEKVQSYMQERSRVAEEGNDVEKLHYALTVTSLQSAFMGTKNFEKIKWNNPNELFEDAAQEGSSVAKYYLGLNMLRGEQCDVVPKKGLFWLQSAANDNITDAKMLLGYEYLSGHHVSQDIPRGMSLLKTAADAAFPHAQVLYAWVLATHPQNDLRSAEQAASYIKRVDSKVYSDQRSYLETQAAIALTRNDWKAAGKMLKKLKKLNDKSGIDSFRQVALEQSLREKRAYTEAL